MFLDLAEASRIISERHTRLHALLPRLRSTSQLLEERENRFRIRSRVGSNILKIFTAAQKLFYLLLNCSYVKEKTVTRARGLFFHGRVRILLFTERFHFFHRFNTLQ